MAMKFARGFLLFSIFVLVLLVNSSPVEGRYHFHKKKEDSTSESNNSDSQSLACPSSNPPSSNDPNDSCSDPCIFDLRSYGAIKDGSTDDTSAFRSAWKEVCSVESGVLLVPSGYMLAITSTIFTGPCKQGFTFQDGSNHICSKTVNTSSQESIFDRSLMSRERDYVRAVNKKQRTHKVQAPITAEVVPAHSSQTPLVGPCRIESPMTDQREGSGGDHRKEMCLRSCDVLERARAVTALVEHASIAAHAAAELVNVRAGHMQENDNLSAAQTDKDGQVSC